MKRVLVIGCAAVLAGAIITITFAQGGRKPGGRPGGPPPCANPIPADKQANLLQDFGDKGIDANTDGELTCDEIKAFFDANPSLRPPPPPHGPPPCADPLPADMQSKLMKDFGDKGIDANTDGKLTCAEVKAFFDANPALMPPPPPRGPRPCADPIPADIQSKLLEDFGGKGIDANTDGKLTCAEVKAFFDANPSLRPPRPPHGPPPSEPGEAGCYKAGNAQMKPGTTSKKPAAPAKSRK